MISLKLFVEAIHEAIINANNTLMDKNVGLLDKYFEEVPQENPKVKEDGAHTNLVPKNVVLEYPVLDSTGKVTPRQIQVPLITMVPLGMSQIEKATLTADFELVLVDDELQITFPAHKNEGLFHKNNDNPNTTSGKLEIVITPQEPSEGLKLLVEAYEAALKRQIL
jgi:hypothetical protein